jgi:hypothetical protein
VEVHHAVAALAGFHVDHYLVYEHATIISEAILSLRVNGTLLLSA